MNLVSYFYEMCPGVFTEDEANLHITQGTISYLQDSGFTDGQIIDMINSLDRTDVLTPDLLPDSLWKDSLIKRNTFYYHRELQILPPPPVRDVRTGKVVMPDYFLEIRIRYTMEDLVQHFYKAVSLDPALNDIKRDSGSFNYLLQKYDRVPEIEGLDMVLELIRLARASTRPITQAVTLSQYESEALENMRGWASEARLRKADHIVWRFDKWLQ